MLNLKSYFLNLRLILDLPKIPDIAKPEKAFCLIKPDAIYRGIIGKVTSRFEQVGLKLVYCRMLMAKKEQVKKHYHGGPGWLAKFGQKTIDMYKDFGIDAKEHLKTEDPEEIGKEVYKRLIEYIMSGPVIVMVWEGVGANHAARKIRGTTTPLSAEVGSIIGDCSHDSNLSAPFKNRCLRNLVHLSENKEEAEKEMKIWLGDDPKFEEYQRVDEPFF